MPLSQQRLVAELGNLPHQHRRGSALGEGRR
jgi:hypothetical protein